MKKKLKATIILCFATLFSSAVLTACKKSSLASFERERIDVKLPKDGNVELQTSFAKILAKAVNSDVELRRFIQEYSLKEFDKDHDVLYQLVKNERIGSETFKDKLVKYANSKDLGEIENKLPLLTIFVPTLPNFSAKDWNVNSDVPLIAVPNMDRENTTSLYDHNGEEIKLKATQIPGFPVLVIKQNERVKVKVNTNMLASNSSTSGTNLSSSISFEFIDEAFNGKTNNRLASASTPSFELNKKERLNGKVSRVAPVSSISTSSSIDQVNLDAYNSGTEWHRDYVYYGLTPNSPNGKFRHNYSEFITSFKCLLPNALGLFSDQDDPKVNNSYATGSNPGNLPRAMWTEGNFEFKITVLINAKNGLGTDLTKIMSIRPYDLFDLQYRLLKDFRPFLNRQVYEIVNTVPKEYNPNIELLPWDLENYGTAWKFILYEMDSAQEVVQSYENTTTYSANFDLNGGQFEKVKIGFKFGASATTTEKRIFSVKTTLNSDYLGDFTLTFDQPIITGYANGLYTTREITNGNTLSMSVEPRRIF